MVSYRSRTDIPPLVHEAVACADRLGFTRSCIPEVGRLLAVLTARVQDGVIGEIGTGCGVAAAWMASYLVSTARLITVELDATCAQAATAVFHALPNVRVLHGDWTEILPHGPFDLLFVDGGPLKAPMGGTLSPEVERVAAAMRPGGIVVLDDLGPEALMPAEWREQPDPVRVYWLNDPRFVATEILTTPKTVAILATRVVSEPEMPRP